MEKYKRSDAQEHPAEEPKAAKSKNYRAKWFGIRAAMVLYDIVAVNFAYIFAVFLRFYVASQFSQYAVWVMPAHFKFAPYYTVCCIVVFYFFKLYSAMWKYAGVHDMNRIVLASIVTSAIQVGGTLLFFDRMPITYYALGGLIQFFLIAASRFSYRFLTAERAVALRGKKQTEINVMIVGMGETAQIVRKKIDRDHGNAAHPVCVLDAVGGDAVGLIDGLPIVSGVDKLDGALKKYAVACVILADSIMTAETRRKIKEICEAADVGVQDFSGYFQNEGAELTLKKLMQYTTGTVEVVVDGTSQTFENGEKAVMAMTGAFGVKAITAHDGRIVVELVRHKVLMNNTNETWVREFEQETGESVSFF